jgi:plastocyanin
VRLAAALALAALLALGVAAPADSHCRTRHHKRICDRPAKKPAKKPARKPAKKPARKPAKKPAPKPTSPTTPGPTTPTTPGGDPTSPGDSPPTTTPGTDPTSPGTPPPSLPRRVGVDEKEYSLTPSYLKLAAGTIEVNVTNFGMDDHDLSIRVGSGAPLKTVAVAAGKTEVFDVTLAAGTYTFYCSLADHETLGMKQTVTVE